MNIIRRYRDFKKLTVVIGVVLALIILGTQASVYYLNDNVQVTYKMDNEDEDGTQPVAQYLSKDAIAVSSVQLNIDKPFQVVFELLLPEDEIQKIKAETVPLCLEFFKNLFRLTISPNAP